MEFFFACSSRVSHRKTFAVLKMSYERQGDKGGGEESVQIPWNSYKTSYLWTINQNFTLLAVISELSTTADFCL